MSSFSLFELLGVKSHVKQSELARVCIYKLSKDLFSFLESHIETWQGTFFITSDFLYGDPSFSPSSSYWLSERVFSAFVGAVCVLVAFIVRFFVLRIFFSDTGTNIPDKFYVSSAPDAYRDFWLHTKVKRTKMSEFSLFTCFWQSTYYLYGHKHTFLMSVSWFLNQKVIPHRCSINSFIV